MRNTRTELRLECRKRKTHRAKRLPTSPKMKNREYKTASDRRRVLSSNEHTVWFAKEVEVEKGEERVEMGREELGEKKGKGEADEKAVIVSDEGQLQGC